MCAKRKKVERNDIRLSLVVSGRLDLAHKPRTVWGFCLFSMLPQLPHDGGTLSVVSGVQSHLERERGLSYLHARREKEDLEKAGPTQVQGPTPCAEEPLSPQAILQLGQRQECVPESRPGGPGPGLSAGSPAPLPGSHSCWQGVPRSKISLLLSTQAAPRSLCQMGPAVR